MAPNKLLDEQTVMPNGLFFLCFLFVGEIRNKIILAESMKTDSVLLSSAPISCENLSITKIPKEVLASFITSYIYKSFSPSRTLQSRSCY